MTASAVLLFFLGREIKQYMVAKGSERNVLNKLRIVFRKLGLSESSVSPIKSFLTILPMSYPADVPKDIVKKKGQFVVLLVANECMPETYPSKNEKCSFS